MQRRSVWPRVLLVRPDLPDEQDVRSWDQCHTLVAAGYEVTVIGPPTTWATLKGLRYYPRRPRRGLLSRTRTCVVSGVLCLRALVGHGFSVLQWSGPPDELWIVAAPYRLLGKKLLHDRREAQAVGDGARRWRRRMERASARVAHRVITGTPVPVARPRALPAESAPELLRDRAHLCCGIDPVGGRPAADVLVHAWAALVHELGRRDVALALLTSPAEARRLQPLVDLLDLHEHVDLVPRTDPLTVARYLATAQVAVRTELSGRLPDAVLSGAVGRAMAAGLPHVVFDLPELRTVLQAAALYAPPGDVMTMARHVAALVDDEALRAAMGARAELRGRALLQWRAEGPAYVRVVDDLLGIPDHGPVVVLPRAAPADSAPRYVVRLDARRASRRQAQRRQRSAYEPPVERREVPTRRRGDRRDPVVTAGWGVPRPRQTSEHQVGRARDDERRR